MQEKQLIKIMLKEWPDEAFSVGKETWCHIPHANNRPTPKFNISIIKDNLPGGCIIFHSSKDWQTVYDKFLLWKEEQI